MAEKTTYKYDAFISYRHSDTDKYVAETLHKRLEAFQLPRKLDATLVNGERKIKRVFRDEEELPLATNLEDPIIEALRNSDWLIVICTPRLNQSEWCKKEISTFIEMHGRNRVLLVLAEGEPAESFPELMKFDEKRITNDDGTITIQKNELDPLAADFRGKNKKEISQKADTEIFRLLARMYNVNFDDLRRRHHEIEVRRKIILASIIAAVSLVIGAVGLGSAIYISHQNDIIVEKNDEILKKNEEIADKNATLEDQKQQLILNQVSSQLTLAELERESNPLNALQIAYDSATEMNGIKMYYTPEAQRLMTDILHLYDNGTQFHLCDVITLNSTILDMQSSQSGRYSAYRTTSHECVLIDAKTMNIIKTYTSISGSDDYIFAGDNYFVAKVSDDDSYKAKIVVYQLADGVERVLDVWPNSINVSSDNTKLLISNDDSIDIYDINSFELINSIKSEEDGIFNFFATDDFLIFQTGDIVIMSDEDGNYIENTYDAECNNYLYIYSIETGELLYYENVDSRLIKHIVYYDGILCVSMNHNGLNNLGHNTIALTINPKYNSTPVDDDIVSEDTDLPEDTDSSENTELPDDTADIEDDENVEDTIEDTSYPLMKLWENNSQTMGCTEILHQEDIQCPEWIFYIYGNSVEAINIYTGEVEFGVSFASTISKLYLLDSICTAFLTDGTVESINYFSSGMGPTRQGIFGIKSENTKYISWYGSVYLAVNKTSSVVQIYRITYSPDVASIESLPSNLNTLEIHDSITPAYVDDFNAFKEQYKDVDATDINSIYFSEDKSLFFINRNNGMVDLYDGKTGKLLLNFENETGFWFCSCMQNNDYYFVGSYSSITYMISKETNQIVANITNMVGADDKNIYVSDDMYIYSIDDPDAKFAYIPIYSPEDVLEYAKETLETH